MAGERELGVALNPPRRPPTIQPPVSPRRDRFAGMSDLERIAFALKSVGAGLQKAGGRQNVADPGAELLEGQMQERLFGLREEQLDISRQRLKSEMTRTAAQQNLNTIKAQLQAIKDFEPGMAAKVVNMLQIANAGQGIDNPGSLVEFVQQNQKEMEDRLSQIDPNNLDREDILFIGKLASKITNPDAAKAFLASVGVGGGALPKLGVDVTGQLAVLAGRIGLKVDQIDPRNPVHARLIDQAIEKVGQARIRERRETGVGREVEQRRTDFAKSSLRVQDAVQNIDQIVKTLDEAPEVFGASGGIAVSVVGVADQIGNFARILNPNFSVDQTVGEVFDKLDDFASGTITEAEFANKATEPFRQRLERVARGNRVLQGRIMGLAISLATVKAIDGRGRLTSDMVNRQIEEIGATIQSPQAFRASILRVRSDLISRLEDRRRIMLQSEVPTFGPPPQRPGRAPGTVQVTPPIQAPPEGLKIPTLNEAQQRAIQEAEEGQEFTLGGQRFIKRGGTLVPAGR